MLQMLQERRFECGRSHSEAFEYTQVRRRELPVELRALARTGECVMCKPKILCRNMIKYWPAAVP